MRLDKELEFSDAQAVTTAEATASTNIVDLGKTGLSVRQPLRLVVKVNTTVTSAGAATVQTKIITSDSATFASGNVTLFDSGAIAKATLVAGYQICDFVLPKGLLRYLKVEYTPAVADLTAGKFDAFIVLDNQTA